MCDGEYENYAEEPSYEFISNGMPTVDPDDLWAMPGYEEDYDPSRFETNPDDELIDVLTDLLQKYPEKKVYSFLCTLIGRQDLASGY